MGGTKYTNYKTYTQYNVVSMSRALCGRRERATQERLGRCKVAMRTSCGHRRDAVRSFKGHI